MAVLPGPAAGDVSDDGEALAPGLHCLGVALSRISLETCDTSDGETRKQRLIAVVRHP